MEMATVIYRIKITFKSEQTLAFLLSFKIDTNYTVYSFVVQLKATAINFFFL